MLYNSLLLTEKAENQRLGAFRVLRRQVGVQLNVADRLAAARMDEIKAAAIACAALLQRSHLQLVAIVDVSAHCFRRYALADVANGVNLFAQRRVGADACMQLGVHNAFILGRRLKIEEVRARIVAVLLDDHKIGVSGVL